MSDQFVAEIRLFPFNFAPNGWAMCNGQILPISQNTALFSLVGTMYGGNGQSNFGLPNLQGRLPMGTGSGTGLTPRVNGEQDGSENVTLLSSEIPAHKHTPACNASDGDDYGPVNNIWAPDAGGSPQYAAASNATMNPGQLLPAGSGLPHNNLQPYLVVNFCIALQGIFPPRG